MAAPPSRIAATACLQMAVPSTEKICPKVRAQAPLLVTGLIVRKGCDAGQDQHSPPPRRSKKVPFGHPNLLT